jgi:predicted alpha/beta hydrolase family esterase
MPEPWEPDYEKFKKEFEKLPINENTILIGHSCGGAFLVRWLGESKRKIDTLLLVAPWKIPEHDGEVEKLFYGFDVDETIRGRVNKIIMFTSDDEEVKGKESLQVYHAALGGEVVALEGKGHFTMYAMGTVEFPELLNVIAT